MAKLIHILAASVGGGLVLGASIRLGEAIGTSGLGNQKKRERQRNREIRPEPRDARLTDRLERLEKKIGGSPEPGSPRDWQVALSGVIARMDRQQDEMEAIQDRLNNQPTGSVSSAANTELHRQIKEEIDRRLADVEAKLQLRLEAANGDAVSAMAASIEDRLAPRIERMESEISHQSAAVAELRDCSLQSERSIQRLLTVLERTLGPKGRAGETGSGLSVMTGRGQR